MSEDNQLTPEDLLELFRLMDEGQVPTPDQLAQAVLLETDNREEARRALMKFADLMNQLVQYFDERIGEG